MYPFERFTERAKKVLTLAQEEAERSHHSYIGTEHLLLGLMRVREGLACHVLTNLGIEIDEVRVTIDSVLGRNERIIIQQIIPTSRVKKVIEISFDEARRMGHNYVGTEHMLLALLIEGEGIAAHVLQDLGATLEKARSEIELLLPTWAEASAVRARPPTFKVGDRVLVHDAEPPHRLWEGRVMTVTEGRCDIYVAGHPAGDVVAAEHHLMHEVPMRVAVDCRYCWSS